MSGGNSSKDIPGQYTDRYDTVVSADESGFVEYWQPREPWEPPQNIPGLWELKSSTDLYEFKKVLILNLLISPRTSADLLGTLPDEKHPHFPVILT